jgi:hypothetical protein
VRFELTQRIRAPLEAVEAAFVDPDFIAELATLPKLGRPELLDQEDGGDHLSQRVRYAFAGELSARVKAVIDPKKLTWVEVSTLDRATHCTTFKIVPDYYGRMLEASGEISLTTAKDPSDGEARTLRQAEGQLVVHMPIVGRKVEAAIIGGLREHADLEVAVVERWATDHA